MIVGVSLLLQSMGFVILYKKIDEEKFFPIADSLFVIIISLESIILNIVHLQQINLMVNCVVLIFIYKLIYKKSLNSAFGYTLLSTILFYIIKNILILPLCFTLVEFKLGDQLTNLIGGLELLVLSAIIYKFLNVNIYNLKIVDLLKKSKFFAFNLILYILALQIVIVYNNKFSSKYFVPLIGVLFIYLIISILLSFDGEKIKEQAIQIETYEKYSPMLFELIAEIKSRQHDYKNHINTIYGIVQTEDESNLKVSMEQYLTSLNNSFVKLDKNIVIDNKIVVAIIYAKDIMAKSKNIEFIYNINCSLKDIKLQDYEISEVLNNLIDNAFEAVENEQDKQVFLSISYINNNYIIETENKGLKLKTNEVNKICNNGFTTKGDRNHGYGLYNVKRIIESYNGKIQLNVNGRNLRISLYVPAM
jgi:two-component system sensor histidine kinase AgrC